MNKKFKLSILWLMSLLMALMAFSPAISAEQGEGEAFGEPLIKYDFEYLDEQTEMPILGYVGVPGAGVNNPNESFPGFMTRSNLDAYKAAGFNILSGLYERVPHQTHEVRKALKLCEEKRLTYFVNDVSYICSASQVLDKEQVKLQMSNDFYFSSPAFGGVATKDEPSILSFEPMKAVCAAIKELTSGKKIMYTNLYPKAATSKQLGFSDREYSTWEEYERYVKDFVDITQPTVLPYDCYVLTHPNAKVSDANGQNGEAGDYIRSLSLFRKVAAKQNIPFWVTVTAFDHVTGRNYIPYKQTAWTINTSLAYGAKGIQYYTYWNNEIEYTTIANGAEYERGLVSVGGAKYDSYYRIQEINNRVKAIDHILMQAEHKGVIQFGTQHLNLVPEDTLYSFGQLSSISGDVFVGCFKYEGRDVYYIVNNSVDSGIKTFRADFIGKVNVKAISYDYITEENPSGEITFSDTYSVGFNLAGGDAVLLEVIS